MIVLAEKKDLAPIAQYQETDSFACRILCIANMYENYPFADFWIQRKKRQSTLQHICQKWTA